MSALALSRPEARFAVLNVGSGPANPSRLHSAFTGEDWREVRLDIEPGVRPDIVGDMSDMRGTVASESFEAIWSSHNVEHLPAHKVAPAIAEFARVLKPGGFALVTCPDIEAVARLVIDQGLDAVAYLSPAGPVTARDMLWGHGASIAAGHGFMAHRTGFTVDSIAEAVLANGFAELRVVRERFALWALCLKSEGSLGRIEPFFRDTAQRELVLEDAEALPPPSPPSAGSR